MTNKEILQDALNILEPIPADKWLRGDFYDDNGNGCALGLYCMAKGTPKIFHNMVSASAELRTASRAAYYKLHPKASINASIVSINNEPIYGGYTEPEIKDRVIHFLKDAVAIEEDF